MKPTPETVKAFAVELAAQVWKLAQGLYGIERGTTTITMRAARSWGNAKGIKLNLGYYVQHQRADGSAYYWEYSHIKGDSEIGSMDTCHWTEQIASLVTHEIAHAVQLAISEDSKKAIMARSSVKAIPTAGIKSADAMWHGHDWQAIYRELRTLALGR